MKTLIIGDGEVGKALYNVLSDHDPIIIDKDSHRQCQFDVIHICFPYSDEFINEVKGYQKKHNPQYTIIHSTVPVGTSKQCNAIHSPVIGIHPHLEKSIRIFTKYLGGEQAGKIADYFRRAGLKVCLFDKSETTELMKILDTTHYGIEIEYVKEVKELCNRFGVPFEAWGLWVDNYNKGYEKLGYSEYCKPNLVPIMEKIGGHCVLNNCELLDSKFTQFLKNEKTK